MTKPTSQSSDLSPNQESGVTDSLWQPSWLQWLISALSGTVETEKQIAWLKKYNEELRKSNEEMRKYNEEWLKNELKYNEELRKSNEELRKRHEEWLKNEDKYIESLRRENARLAELESKLDAVLHKSAINSNPIKPTDKN